MRRASFALAGVAVATLATFGGLYGWAAVRQITWEDDRDQLDAWAAMSPGAPGRPPQGELDLMTDRSDQQRDQIDGLTIAGWTMLGVGVASLAAAVGLYLAAPRSDRGPAVAVLPSLGGVNVALEWP